MKEAVAKETQYRESYAVILGLLFLMGKLLGKKLMPELGWRPPKQQSPRHDNSYSQ